VLVVVIGLAGCQAAPDEPSPTPSATDAPSSSPSQEASAAPSTAPTEGEQVSVFDLEAGDCFSAVADELDSVTVVACDQAHVYEAYFVFDHEAGSDEPYPGDQAVLEYADEACQPPFEEFVDFSYADSIWYITSVTPSAETWAEGDREIVCTVNQQDANEEPIEVTGSAEAAAE
jgi:hypothetical protein